MRSRALVTLALLLAVAAFTGLIWLVVSLPEPRCRTVCIKDHTELRAYLRPSYSGSAQIESDVMPVSVCDEYREACRPDAAASPAQDMAASARRAELLKLRRCSVMARRASLRAPVH